MKNHYAHGLLGLTPAGSPKLQLVEESPDFYRGVNALAHDVAAALERASVGRRWAIGMDADKREIRIELVHGDDSEAATELLCLVAKEQGIPIR